jgi:hypothetical protein
MLAAQKTQTAASTWNPLKQSKADIKKGSSVDPQAAQPASRGEGRFLQRGEVGMPAVSLQASGESKQIQLEFDVDQLSARRAGIAAFPVVCGRPVFRRHSTQLSTLEDRKPCFIASTMQSVRVANVFCERLYVPSSR